ncbi:inversin-B-like [Nasonia vitripennis]|uniref:Uncharacterized protein n=1 Tax=Nasonia vitripennis TaxID=7425 RepID=A0A7M7Q0J4_NASVI|nr:inversin-B-like [Nasonia vitripennis]
MFGPNYITFRVDKRHGYYVDSTSSDPYGDEQVKNYDEMLCRALGKIFQKQRRLQDSFIQRIFGPVIQPLTRYAGGQINELLRASDLDFMVKRILELEPGLSSIFPKGNNFPLLWIAVLGSLQNSAELLVRSGGYVNERCLIKLDHCVEEKWNILQLVLKMYPSSWNDRFIGLLLDHGADFEDQDPNGETVLHSAVSRCRVRVTKLLLEKGADANVRGAEGRVPMLTAAGGKKADELVPLLMKYKADVTARDSDGQSVLHRLASSSYGEHVDLAKTLIRKGVSVDGRDSIRQYQPIHWAVQCGKHKLVNLLLDNGADVNAQMIGGESPLYLAVQYACPIALLRTLLNRGANVDLKTIGGQTVLHNACRHCNKKNVKIMKLLLSVGANVFAEDRHGFTPLVYSNLNDIEDIEEKFENPSIRLMLKSLALKKASLESTDEVKDERVIKLYPKLWTYYQVCQAHVAKAKSTKFIKNCTYFHLLTQDHRQLVARLRNPSFDRSNVKLTDLRGFFIYTEDILRALHHAQKHYRFIASNVLPWMVVKKRVACYMDKCEECDMKQVVQESRKNGENPAKLTYKNFKIFDDDSESN